MEQILDILQSHPDLFGGALLIGLEFFLRKWPKALPILQLISKLALTLDKTLDKLPGLKNKE